MADPSGTARPHVLPRHTWGFELLVACYLLPLALLPWVAPEPPASGGIATLIGGLLIALFVWRARPSRGWRSLDHDFAVAAPKSIHLTSDSRGRTNDVCYVAVARFGDGSEQTVCQAASPTPVLTAAVSLQRRSGARLMPGWGLQQRELDQLLASHGRARTLPASRYVGATRAGGRAGAVSLLASAAALSLLVAGFTMLADTRLTSAGIALWIAAVALLSLFAWMCVTSNTTVTLGDTVRLERRVCGVLLRSRELSAHSIALLKLVGPGEARGQHLLLAGDELMLDWECSAALGWQIETAFERHRHHGRSK